MYLRGKQASLAFTTISSRSWCAYSPGMKLTLKVGKAVKPVDIEGIDPVFEDVGKLVSASEGYLLSSVVFVAKGKRYKLSSASDARTSLADAGMYTC
jgi:hypothetical protein